MEVRDKRKRDRPEPNRSVVRVNGPRLDEKSRAESGLYEKGSQESFKTGQFKVLIGIQARSDSTRLPGKVNLDIGGMSLVQRVIKSCRNSASFLHLSNRGKPSEIHAHVALLVPDGDGLFEAYKGQAKENDFIVIQGSKEDVLSRYVKAAKETQVDYVCRITADCPVLSEMVISKHISAACAFKLDYISNVHEDFRTFADGSDCEVFSAKLLEYADENAKLPYDREHVTTYMRKFMPIWARKGHITDKEFDKSDIKYSVDTQEEYDLLKRRREAKERKDSLAISKGYKLITF
jgi:spore coat polysaccharide biosynthesis protein SpsF (cytidylyltransferase family)